MLARLSIFLSETYGTFTDIIIPKSPTAQRITKKSGIFVERHAPGEAAESDQNIRPHGYFYLREQHAERNIEQTAEHLSVAGSRPHELSDKVYRGRDIVRRAGEHIESRSAENEHKSERGYCPGVDFYF